MEKLFEQEDLFKKKEDNNDVENDTEATKEKEEKTVEFRGHKIVIPKEEKEK